MVQTLSQTTPTLDPVTERYFQHFNQGNYAAVATLFSDEGCLCPPFEEAIVGPPAIATYLAQEAAGMRAIPKESHTQPIDSGRQVTVKGRVKTPLFTVNVQWIFDISTADHIQRTEIKLLASLQELLQFNRG
ncbi:MAG: nuclear transport factor 2 family protein [Spirulina sp.]